MKIKINFFSKIILLFFLSLNSYGNIIYDKENLLITSIELDDFIQIYNNNGIEILNKNDALKKYIFIKKILKKLKKNNPNLVKQIDTEINNQFGDLNEIQSNRLDILRYQKIFSIYKKEYFDNDFLKSDLKKIFLEMNSLELPLSINNCNTIDRIFDFRDNNQFVDLFFKNIKQNLNIYEINLDNTTYTICMNIETFQKLEVLIVNYLDKQIDLKLKKYNYKN
tara:strand:+ start:5202 stop:5870 length:669 start_codon:yes stop_codon:yes gene_type:complete